MLLRILKRIRQTSTGQVNDPELRCQPEAVAVLFFEPKEDGTTEVHQLRITRGGDFMDRWPRGFFDERNAELFDE
jgi:predicted ATPase